MYLQCFRNWGEIPHLLGKVGKDSFGEMLVSVVKEQGISAEGICYDEKIPNDIGFCT